MWERATLFSFEFTGARGALKKKQIKVKKEAKSRLCRTADVGVFGRSLGGYSLTKSLVSVKASARHVHHLSRPCSISAHSNADGQGALHTTSPTTAAAAFGVRTDGHGQRMNMSRSVFLFVWNLFRGNVSELFQ